MKIFNIAQLLLSLIPISIASNINCEKFYTVQKNDYCYGIAAGNGISLTKLKILNPDLNCNKITAGTSVCIEAQLHYSDYVNYISVDGRCGEGVGHCPSGECCGSDGYCGTGSDYCGIGCQKEFGQCDLSSTIDKRDDINEGDENKINSIDNDIKEKVNDAVERVFPDPAEAAQFKSFSKFALVGFENALDFNQMMKGVELQHINTDECKAKCDDALVQFETIVNDPNNNFDLESYNKVLEESNQGTIDKNYYHNICINQCNLIGEFKHVYANANIDKSVKLINEEIKVLEELKDSYSKLIKRNKYDCSMKESYITIDHYLNDDKDLPVYNSNDGSKFISKVSGRVDGCSAQYKILEDFVYFFTPACNGHDSCYHCSNNKEECDNAFLDNMYTLCDKGYSVIPRPKALFACKAVAISVRLIVKYADFAFDGYRGDQDFVTTNRSVDKNNNALGDYCVCDDYDMEHFVSKLYTFTPYV